MKNIQLYPYYKTAVNSKSYCEAVNHNFINTSRHMKLLCSEQSANTQFSLLHFRHLSGRRLSNFEILSCTESEVQNNRNWHQLITYIIKKMFLNKGYIFAYSKLYIENISTRQKKSLSIETVFEHNKFSISLIICFISIFQII